MSDAIKANNLHEEVMLDAIPMALGIWTGRLTCSDRIEQIQYRNELALSDLARNSRLETGISNPALSWR